MKVQTENKSYVRDVHNKALLSTDRKEMNRIQAEREKARRMANLMNRISVLEENVEYLLKNLPGYHGNKV